MRSPDPPEPPAADPASPTNPSWDGDTPVSVIEPPPAPHVPAWRRPEVWHGYAVRAYGALEALRRRAPRLVATARAIYYPAALALVVWMGMSAVRALDMDQVNWAALAGSLVTALVWWLALAYGWANLVTERFQHDQVGRWARTQVTRYLPGGIWAPLTRTTLVHGRIRDKLAAVTAENVVQLCVALAVGAMWMVVHDPRWLPLVALLALPLAVSGWLQRQTRVTRRGIVRAGFIYAVGWVSYGLSGLLAQVAITGVRAETYPLFIAGAACIAWAVGLVVVFAPGGVGVREVVYIWFLSSLYSRAGLEGGSVTLRLATVAAELAVLLVMGRSWARRGAREPEPSPARTDQQA